MWVYARNMQFTAKRGKRLGRVVHNLHATCNNYTTIVAVVAHYMQNGKRSYHVYTNNCGIYTHHAKTYSTLRAAKNHVNRGVTTLTLQIG
jgi:hypothetical protein